MTAMLLRPVRDTPQDAEAVCTIAATVLGGSERGPADPGGRSATVRLPAAAGAESEGSAPEQAPPPGHIRRLARTDPDGCWLAEDTAGSPVGAALSLRREGTWGIALLAVVPRARGKGVGTLLLQRATGYGRACLRGLMYGPRLPGTARCCRRAGLTVHPVMQLTGRVDPSRLDAPDGGVVTGGSRQRDLMDSVDRRLRGGAHGPDHEELLRGHRLLVSDDLAGSGYCYLRGGTVELLAATSRRLAARLLTAALLSVPNGTAVRVGRLTAEQEWAVDVGLAAGLELTNAGYLGLRGMRPPSPYIPSAFFL